MHIIEEIEPGERKKVDNDWVEEEEGGVVTGEVGCSSEDDGDGVGKGEIRKEKEEKEGEVEGIKTSFRIMTFESFLFFFSSFFSGTLVSGSSVEM